MSSAKGGTFSEQSEENLSAVPCSKNAPIAGNIQNHVIQKQKVY
jgi:hypothetical protein